MKGKVTTSADALANVGEDSYTASASRETRERVRATVLAPYYSTSDPSYTSN